MSTVLTEIILKIFYILAVVVTFIIKLCFSRKLNIITKIVQKTFYVKINHQDLENNHFDLKF